MAKRTALNPSTSFTLNDSESYVTPVHGVLTVSLNDDTDKAVGTMQTWIVRIAEMQNDQCSPSSNDALGWVGIVETVACEEMMAFLTHGAQLKESVGAELGDDSAGCTSVHIIESIQIDPNFRGRGLGLFFMHRYIRCVAMMNPCDVIMAHPAPIEAESEAQRKVIAKKLRSHWGRLGLKPLKRSEYSAMVA